MLVHVGTDIGLKHSHYWRQEKENNTDKQKKPLKRGVRMQFSRSFSLAAIVAFIGLN